jgi:hypothetical protein
MILICFLFCTNEQNDVAITKACRYNLSTFTTAGTFVNWKNWQRLLLLN